MSERETVKPQFIHLRPSNETFVTLYYRRNSGCPLVIRYISAPYLLFDKKRLVEIDQGVLKNANQLLSGCRSNVLYYLLHFCTCSPPRVKGEQTIFYRSEF